MTMAATYHISHGPDGFKLWALTQDGRTRTARPMPVLPLEVQRCAEQASVLVYPPDATTPGEGGTPYEEWSPPA